MQQYKHASDHETRIWMFLRFIPILVYIVHSWCCELPSKSCIQSLIMIWKLSSLERLSVKLYRLSFPFNYQWIFVAVEAFKEEHISSNILKRLLKQDIFVQQKFDEKSIDSLLYIAKKPADYFIIILQGKCSVEIGKDNYRFEAGPFYCFGAQALSAGGT